jgi:hypothetical protein
LKLPTIAELAAGQESKSYTCAAEERPALRSGRQIPEHAMKFEEGVRGIGHPIGEATETRQPNTMQETTEGLNRPILDETPFPDLKGTGTGRRSFHGDRLRCTPTEISEQCEGPAEGQVDLATDVAKERELLLAENAELREKVTQLDDLLDNANRATLLLEEQQKDFDKMLEEKSEVIRELHQKLQESQNRPAAEAPHEEELLALSEELERDRKQLKEDEEALMAQMRQMEVQMARERAELGRQRNELQQLHNEIRHELTRASREAELRTRMQPFQRRHQDMTPRRSGEAAPANSEEQIPMDSCNQPHKSKDSGIFRRLFG